MSNFSNYNNFSTLNNYLGGAPISYPSKGMNQGSNQGSSQGSQEILAMSSGYGGIGYSSTDTQQSGTNYSSLEKAYKQTTLFSGPYSARMCKDCVKFF